MPKVLAGIAIGIVAVATLVFLARRGDTDPDDYTNREAAALRQRTVPSTAKFLGQSGVTRSSFAAETSWEFETEQDWLEYTRWVKEQLTPDYPATDSEDGKVAFHKNLTTDAHDLTIQRLTQGRPLRVRATFRSYPQ